MLTAHDMILQPSATPLQPTQLLPSICSATNVYSQSAGKSMQPAGSRKYRAKQNTINHPRCQDQLDGLATLKKNKKATHVKSSSIHSSVGHKRILQPGHPDMKDPALHICTIGADSSLFYLAPITNGLATTSLGSASHGGDIGGDIGGDAPKPRWRCISPGWMLGSVTVAALLTASMSIMHSSNMIIRKKNLILILCRHVHMP